MIIVVVDEGLEVADLNLLLASVALYQGVQLEEHVAIAHHARWIRPVAKAL